MKSRRVTKKRKNKKKEKENQRKGESKKHNTLSLVLHLSDLLLGNLTLLTLLGAVTTLKDGTTILVELKLGDLNVAGVDANLNSGAVGLLASDLVDVDHPLLTVDLNDLTVTALGGTTHDDDLIVLADGHATNVVLLAELLGERGAHHDTTNTRGSVEVCTTSNTTRRRNVYYYSNKTKQSKQKGEYFHTSC